ncbi:hypothetical protein [Aquimarina megaterium]|uniref:hypothetical protein n=1 Tax=Aquimarina megaterium TaxID=1443666 RepID=UPI00047245A6|nr:hypothetical protein [Aquimarina megaterium]
MKLFPTKYYSIELLNDSSIALTELKNHTLSDEQFVADWNNQVFIGKIYDNEFEIKLSKNLYGAFCVLNGKLEKRCGTLEIRVGKTFKILFLIIVLFAISVLVISTIQNRLDTLFQSVIAIISLRFIFIEFGFRIISKTGLDKLTRIIGIIELKKNEA